MARAAKDSGMNSPTSPLLTYARGRFIRDPHISDRKDNSGNKAILSAIRIIRNYTDNHGDSRSQELTMDVRIYRPDVANPMAQTPPKAGDMIELWGSMTNEVEEYTDRQTGEPKTTRKWVMTVSEYDAEHTAKLV